MLVLWLSVLLLCMMHFYGSSHVLASLVFSYTEYPLAEAVPLNDSTGIKVSNFFTHSSLFEWVRFLGN